MKMTAAACSCPVFLGGLLIVSSFPSLAQVLPPFPPNAQDQKQSAPKTVTRFKPQSRPSSGELQVIPMVFPVTGKVNWVDTYNPNGEGGKRMHHGEDLMAPKLRPLVAAFNGTVRLRSGGEGGHYMIFLLGAEGLTALYCHVNNDTPGTNDGKGGDRWAFAPGLKSGDRVTAGQWLGYVGNSGNAEGGAPHCHFELTQNGVYLNPAPSLREARHLATAGTKLPGSETNSLLRAPEPPASPQTEPEREEIERKSFQVPRTALLPSRTNPISADSWNLETFSDFERGNYDGWTLSGNCWGRMPASTDLFPGMITGFRGLFYVNTLVPDYHAVGLAVSRDFTIRHRAVLFRIGGGNYPAECVLRLVVEGKIVASATGDDSAELHLKRFEVEEWLGKTAHLEILDASHSRHRGYIMVDDIRFGDPPRKAGETPGTGQKKMFSP